MTIGLIFWILMLLGLFGYGYGGWPADPAGRWHFGGWFVLWVLLALLGWAAFGSPVKA